MKLINVFALGLPLYLVANFAVANESKAKVWINGDSLQQVCWYQDKKYSEGAIIEVAKLTLMCTRKDKNQPNGQLGWLKLDDKGNIIYPTQKSKISIK